MRGRGRKLGRISPTCGLPWGQPLGISLPDARPEDGPHAHRARQPAQPPESLPGFQDIEFSQNLARSFPLKCLIPEPCDSPVLWLGLVNEGTESFIQ